MIGMSMAMQAPRYASLDAQVQGILKRYDPLAHQWDFTLGQAELNARRNLFTYSEGLISTYSSSNCSNAASTIVGFDNAIQFDANSVARTAYKTFSTIVGKTYTLSIYVVMDDLGAPVPSSQNNTGDFSFVFESDVASVPTVTSFGNGLYRVSGSYYADGLTGTNQGIVKYNTQSARGFKVTGYQLEQSSAATLYQKITDWNAEFLALFPRHHLYQDAGGSIPVTGVEQPIGLVLDEPTGSVVVGSELWNDSTATLTGESTRISPNVYRIYTSAGALSYVSQYPANPCVVGNYYIVDFTIDSITIAGGGITVEGSNQTAFTTIGRKRAIVQAASMNIAIKRLSSVALDYQISNVSIKLVSGAHATQATSTKRPTLSARYNGFTYSEVFSNAAWAKVNILSTTDNAALAPDGTMTACKIVADAILAQHRVEQTCSLPAGSQTFWAILKKDVSAYCNLRIGVNFAGFNLLTGAPTADFTAGVTSSMVPLGDGWYKCIMIDPAAAANSICRINISDDAAFGGGVSTYAGNGTSGMFLWKSQIMLTALSSNLPSYQRVTSSTNYDTVGFPTYTKFDGIDDALVTLGIDFSSTSGVTVVTGFTKLSDATVGLVYEFGTDTTSVNGSFYLTSPANAATADHGVASRGTTTVTATTASSYPASRGGVFTHISSVARPSLSLAVDGVSAASSTSTQGTGNYGSLPLNIGSRSNGASLRFSGNISTITMIGATDPDPLFSTNVALFSMDSSTGLATDVMGNTVILAGSPVARSASPAPKFGDAYLDVAALGSALKIKDASRFDFLGDFTVEGWVYNTDNSTGDIYNIGRVDGLTFSSQNLWLFNGQLTFTASSNNISHDISDHLACGATALGAWSHFAVTRNGAVYRIFLNGVVTRTINVNLKPFTPEYGLIIGNYAVGNWDNLPGQTKTYFDGIRFSRVARYTSNFTPPTAAFPTYDDVPKATEILTLEAYANNKMGKVY